MRLFIDKRPFSWDVEYDVTLENGTKAYHVKNEQEAKRLWSITLYNRNGVEIGKIVRKKSIFGKSKFTIYFDNNPIGTIEKTYVHNTARYMLKMTNWRVFGLIMSWEYDILDDGAIITHAGTEDSPYADSGKFMLDIYYENSESSILLAALGLEAANSLLAEKQAKRLAKKVRTK
ncbi:MAG: hypothetical protein Q4C42_02615 [Clostridia bacterium]|nr:hypothetical protein [Clostridia bacterium]